MKEGQKAQGMKMRDVVDKSRNRKNWRSHRRRRPDGGEKEEDEDRSTKYLSLNACNLLNLFFLGCVCVS